MKIIHTADWHLGSFPGPEQDGINLRSQDTLKCIDFLIEKAMHECPDLTLISGDIFHQARVWVDRGLDEVLEASSRIGTLSMYSKSVIVMRGTPNHDGDKQFEMLASYLSRYSNVFVVMSPQVIVTEDADVAVLPGFDRGVFRAKFPGLSKEEENVVFTQELGNILLGLKAQCRPEKANILMSHYTVPGCNTESGQVQFLTQFEPVITQEALSAANYDLVALGHIHRPQCVSGTGNVFYSGAVNAMNFNDEGQERGFWIHELNDIDYTEEPDPYVYMIDSPNRYQLQSFFYKTPYREFQTVEMNDTDITGINTGDMEAVACNIWRFNRIIQDKIVRVIYTCSDSNNKAFNKALLEKQLYEDGAFYVSEITPDKVDASANRNDLSEQADPEANLKEYLVEKAFTEEQIYEIVTCARPIIAEAVASSNTSKITGVFEPIEIEVKNYRNYEEESFNFEDIRFCTINGQNGAGKSSLFMDAIIDCLYEEPREGDLTGWIRSDEKARAGSISFTFRIGTRTFRVVRTRTKSGKATLALAELVNDEWEDRAHEKMKDTQEDIINILGMDSLTFKSCALIMQDQYGLFLQADKESRMTILGNILGLGIYQDMEKLAADKARDINRELMAKKQTIKVHTETIQAAGNPEAKIEEENKELLLHQAILENQQKERDRINLVVSTMLEASRRIEKLNEGINTLNRKQLNISDLENAQTMIIAQCNAIILNEPEILEGVQRYNSLVEREKELISSNTLYTAKKNELASVSEELKAAEKEKEDRLSEYASLKLSRMNLNGTLDQENFIREKAEAYQVKKHELAMAEKVADDYIRISENISSKQSELSSLSSSYEATLAKCETVIKNLTTKAEILENSNCIDSANAKCKFLADAQEAKKKLETYPADIEKWKSEQLSKIEELKKSLQDMKTELEALGYDAEAIKQKRSEVAGLEQYVKMLENLNILKEKAKSLDESIIKANDLVSASEKRLSEVNLKAVQVEEELKQYEEAAKEYSDIQLKLSIEKAWIEKEKQLPVAKEKLQTASQRLKELEVEAEELSKEISEKRVEIEKEKEGIKDIEIYQTELKKWEQQMEATNSTIQDIQMSIGALNQKVEDNKRIEEIISAVQIEVKKLSQKSSIYETLKNAFSQDGIPHNIIRSILPQLRSTANSILGQMTGGRMGIDFVTEKVLKSNTKKEVVTLDIYIEEYGKSVLPYLSKSGGEKVKSSLSVILALAEVKSTCAGIQLGMLFIDEPPFLDGDGVNAYVEALEAIQSRYNSIKIMAITHDPVFKSKFPQSVDVIKTDRGSKVLYE